MRGVFMLLPFQGADIRGVRVTQGAAPLALGYGLAGLSARPWLMDGRGIYICFCPFRAQTLGETRYPGCRSACPGLCAFWAFSPFITNGWSRGFVGTALVARRFCPGLSAANVFCACCVCRMRVPNPCVPLSRMSAARGGLKARLPEVKTGAFLCCQGIAIV